MAWACALERVRAAGPRRLSSHSAPRGGRPGGGDPAILAARGFLAAGDSHEERRRRLERQNAIDGEDSASDAGFGSAEDLEPEEGAGDSEPEGGDAS
jgi:hypothetical protein